jgi:hypothetical protein
MAQYTRYFGHFRDFRFGFGGLPPWARTIVGIAALPGLILLGLSILAIIVSLSALLLLTVPVYSVLRHLTWSRTQQAPHNTPLGGVRRVEATVIE